MSSVPLPPLMPSCSLWINTSAGSSIVPPGQSSILIEAFVLVLFELALERPQPDAEQVRGLGPVPARALERFEDRLALDVRHGARIARHRLHGAGGRDRDRVPHLDRQVGGLDHLALVE